jgi:hypothetical protein
MSGFFPCSFDFRQCNARHACVLQRHRQRGASSRFFRLFSSIGFTLSRFSHCDEQRARFLSNCQRGASSWFLFGYLFSSINSTYRRFDQCDGERGRFRNLKKLFDAQKNELAKGS